MGKVEHINNYKRSYVWLMSKEYGKQCGKAEQERLHRGDDLRAGPWRKNVTLTGRDWVRSSTHHRIGRSSYMKPSVTPHTHLQKKDASSFIISYSSSTFPVTDTGVAACARREGTAVKRARFLLSRSSLTNAWDQIVNSFNPIG